MRRLFLLAFAAGLAANAIILAGTLLGGRPLLPGSPYPAAAPAARVLLTVPAP